MKCRVRAVSLLSGVAFCLTLSSLPPAAAAEAGKRVVRLGIANPTAGAPEIQISTHEGEAASLALKDVGKFTLLPTMPKGNDKTVLVTISDTDSGRQVDHVELAVAGKPVQPKTFPLQLRVIAVTTPK